MANRDLSDFRTVIGQVVEEPNSMLSATAEFAENLVRQGEEAKILEKASQAQLDLAALENQYKIDYESNPLGGIEQFKKQRQKLYDEVGKGISPLYGRVWREKTGKLNTLSDANQQAWALKQTRVNSVNSLNKNMENSFSQASNDGIAFGNSSDAEVKAFTNFATSLEDLKQFGDRNIGSETTAEVLKDYQEDYMKSFLSGVSVSNPHKALRLLESEEVKNSFNDVDQYMKMESAIASRAKRFDKVNNAKSIGSSMAAANNSGLATMGYAERQQYYADNNVSEEVRLFYDEASGYAKQKAALSEEQKSDVALKLNMLVNDLLEKENPNLEEVKILQDTVFMAKRKSAITPSQGAVIREALIDPVINKIQNDAEGFIAGDDGWRGFFQKNQGVASFRKSVQAKLQPETKSATQMLARKQQELLMYEVYYESLAKAAKDNNVESIFGLNTLPRHKQVEIYNDAEKKATLGLVKNIYPSLRGTKDEDIGHAIVGADGNKMATGSSKAPEIKNIQLPKNLQFGNEADAIKYAKENNLQDGTKVMIAGEMKEWENE